MSSKIKPTFHHAENGPYIVEGLENLQNRKGAVDAPAKMALCRCGGSSNKPFCDGTHAKNGFSSATLEGRTPDQHDHYEGSGITIHDNRGICAHAGKCTDGLPATFKLGTEPWIDPEASPAADVSAVIKTCPSGALTYTVNGENGGDSDREPSVFIAPNGPYVVMGAPDLLGAERLEGASTEHFTLCRCGGSKNKPFCDGTHWHNKFTDDKN
jgi:CDGSH-type Zn-finger protein